MPEVVLMSDLRAVLASVLRYPRFLSIGGLDNTVELRISREQYERAFALASGETLHLHDCELPGDHDGPCGPQSKEDEHD